LQRIFAAKNFVHIADRADIGIAGITAAHSRRIGDHRLQLLPNQRLGITHQD